MFDVTEECEEITITAGKKGTVSSSFMGLHLRQLPTGLKPGAMLELTSGGNILSAGCTAESLPTEVTHKGKPATLK